MARGEDFKKFRNTKSTGFVESTDGLDRRTGIPWVDPRRGDASRGTGLGSEITELIVATVASFAFLLFTLIKFEKFKKDTYSIKNIIFFYIIFNYFLSYYIIYPTLSSKIYTSQIISIIVYISSKIIFRIDFTQIFI